MDFTELYGKNADKQTERYKKLKNTFIKAENRTPDYAFSSPGRAEILGNHTDHNNGKVMVAAISCDTAAYVSKNNDNCVKIYSEGFAPAVVDLNDLKVKPSEYGTSTALTRGIAKRIIDLGYNIQGFTAHTVSGIFKGAGVSSSAAFEVMVAEIFNTLYLNGKLTNMDKATIGQYAENVYFNKPCGLLDQSGIAIGSLCKLDFNIPSEPIIEKLLPPCGYSIVITNTGGDHAALTPHYAAIRTDMSAVSAFFGKKVLRDVDYEEFIDKLPSLRKQLSGRAALRALHYFNENKRVDLAAESLKTNNIKQFIQCINDSGLSSLDCLQNCSVPGDVEQNVIYGIEFSKQFIRDGAVRVHGGGFQGSILAVVSDRETEEYIGHMQKLFGTENVFEASVRESGTAEITF